MARSLQRLTSVLITAVLCWPGSHWYLSPIVMRSTTRHVGGAPRFTSITAYGTCEMYYIGWPSLRGYSIVSRWCSPAVSFNMHPITCVPSAAQCPSWQHVGCCVLLQEVSFCHSGPFRLCNEKHLLWVRQHEMTSSLSWWSTRPHFTVLHLSEVFLLWSWLGWERLLVVVSGKGSIPRSYQAAISRLYWLMYM